MSAYERVREAVRAQDSFLVRFWTALLVLLPLALLLQWFIRAAA